VTWQWEDNPAKSDLSNDVTALKDLENQVYELLRPISTRLDEAWQADNQTRVAFNDTLSSQTTTAWALYDDVLDTCNASHNAEPDRVRHWIDDPILPDDRSWPPSDSTERRPR
jgi:hypothetical protein